MPNLASWHPDIPHPDILASSILGILAISWPSHVEVYAISLIVIRVTSAAQRYAAGPRKHYNKSGATIARIVSALHCGSAAVNVQLATARIPYSPL